MSATHQALDILQRVRSVGRSIDANDPATDAALNALSADTEAPTGPQERLARLAVGALLARRRGGAADTGNLYGGEGGPAEMLGAFEVFVRQTPLVRFAHAAANAAHLAVIGDADAVRIVDVGIGSGSQWEPLLRVLGERPGGPPRVHLVGIDLPGPGPNPTAALDAVGVRLAGAAAEAGVPFGFTALPGRVEDLELPVAQEGECLLINAAFSLHHTRSTDRDPVLRRLAATGAAALVLCEPEADHDAPELPVRLDAALHHYGLLFRVLDRCLRDRAAARAVIEGQFFGRELHNILVGEGEDRVERHAPAVEWSRKLRAAGLCAMPAQAVEIPALPDGVAVEVSVAGTLLTVDGEPLVVVSAWRPGARA